MAYVTRTGLGPSQRYYFRHRMNNSGYATYSSPPDSHSIDSVFVGVLDTWANNVNFTSYTYANGNLGSLAWMGDVGILVSKPNSWHSTGRAMDLTGLYFTSGAGIDARMSYTEDQTGRRKYVGMAASCRYEVATVLGAGYDAAHGDHIHFDNGVGYAPVRKTSAADTVIVKRACNELNNAGVPMTTTWNGQTDTALYNLLAAMNMKCLDPVANASHARVFFSYVARHGFAAKAAGHWLYSC